MGEPEGVKCAQRKSAEASAKTLLSLTLPFSITTTVVSMQTTGLVVIKGRLKASTWNSYHATDNYDLSFTAALGGRIEAPSFQRIF